MFVSIENSPMTYDWGSIDAISEFLGKAPTGSHEAELWFGSHPMAPSKLTLAAGNPEQLSLAEWIEGNRDLALGGRGGLEFLLKLLAAEFPLSLQAHPSEIQAQQGFSRENALGIPVSAVERNYRDPFAKPELLVALSDRFEVLCGFSPLDKAQESLVQVGLGHLAEKAIDLESFLEWLFSGDEAVTEAVAEATEFSRRNDSSLAANTVLKLAKRFPGDPGIVCALLLNRTALSRGEAIFLPAGNIHAYLEGFGIELMASSDNVLRGGLTSKHVDSAELLRILDFRRRELVKLEPKIAQNQKVFEPAGSGLILAWITGDCRFELNVPRIALCTSGSFDLRGEKGESKLGRGDAVFITPDEAGLDVFGSGELFIAAANPRQ